MPLPERLPALLAETTAACGDSAPVTVAGGPVVLRIGGTADAMLATLRTHLVPALRPSVSRGINDLQDIRVVLDSSLARRLEQAITATAPDSEVGEPHRVRDGVHLVRKQAGTALEHRFGYLLWTQDDPQASCIVLGDSGASADTVLLRLVRGVAARVLLAAGWIPLHAACVMTSAGAVCLLGGHGSGKTTALLHLLAGAAGPVALVANFLVFLSPDGRAEARALPAALGLRPPTIKLFPALDSLVGNPDRFTEAARRIYLPASRVAEAFGVKQSFGGPVAACIDVSFRGAQQSRWRSLDTQEFEVALGAAYLPDGLADDPHEHARLAANHSRRHRQRLREFAGSVAAAQLESGTYTEWSLGSAVAGLVAHTAR